MERDERRRARTVRAESAWFRSSYRTGSGGECVAVAAGPDAVHVRDPKDTARPARTIRSGSWAAFVRFAAL
ncbi:DUF397 domain-containing protein [Streptomyces sp. S.PNR 29]|nr:DUF397 domain-containing protein [Streptomyces sp. S.PNR 29]MDN0194896.1 DUF397 domain-containing protein [Streptomyces sp. S.PNR 29]